MNREQVQEAFNNFDANGDGKITIDEYINACRKNGNSGSESSLKDAFKIFDVDSDGFIDFDEFFSAMKFLGQIAD